MSGRPKVILLPGGVRPVGVAYAALLEVLGDEAEVVPKELEIYSGPEPPPGYTLDLEVEGVLRAADASGFGRFHLAGYSAGGATSLALAAKYPERLRSLALLEPAWAGNEGLDPAEEAAWREYDRVMALPPEEMMRAFMRANVEPEVELPPPPTGPAAPWMASRPAGLKAIMRAFITGTLDVDALRGFRAPVYFALGGLSNRSQYGRIAERLGAVFPDFTVEVFEERHHFDPPHLAEPERLVASLRHLWDRGEAVPASS